MIIFFRSCEANLTAGSLGDEVTGDGIRWNGKHKLEIIRKCYLSIQSGQRYYDPFRNVVGIMINRCIQGKPIVIYGDGEQTRSFSNVLDCIEAVYKMMTT